MKPTNINAVCRRKKNKTLLHSRREPPISTLITIFAAKLKSWKTITN